jgi:predicted esterase
MADLIHRYIPPTDPAAVPTLLLLHGTGGNEDDLIPLGRAIAPGVGMLSPRGNTLERGMPRFFKRLAEGVFDLEDLRVRTDELASFVKDAAARHGFEPSRTVAVGYSNGANIGASLLFRHPGLLAGAILLRAMVPFEPEAPPGLTGTSVLLVGGLLDPIVPRAHTVRLAAMLEQFGADVLMDWVSGGHGLTAHDVEVARSWMGGRF